MEYGGPLYLLFFFHLSQKKAFGAGFYRPDALPVTQPTATKHQLLKLTPAWQNHHHTTRF